MLKTNKQITDKNNKYRTNTDVIILCMLQITITNNYLIIHIY